MTALLFEAFFVDEVLADVFDAVLVEKSAEGLVRGARSVVGREEARVRGLDPRARLGDCADGGEGGKMSKIYSPFSLRQIVEFVLLLPLNFIPWVGVPLFLWGTGWRAGPLHHYRLFKLRGATREEKRASVKRRRGAYTA